MALEIRDLPGRPGHAHLIFDRNIDADPLRIAVYSVITREYLGHSVDKPYWTPARSHFFSVTLVERGHGRSVFLVGPEVIDFIPEEMTLELTSEDDTVREIAVWNGPSLWYHYLPPAG
jgi:hypothetical protein